MKKIHYLFSFTISILLLASFPLEAKKKEKVTHPITGVWQRVELRANNDDGKVFIACNPFFKVLNEDGTFFNLSYPERDKVAFIAHAGNYEITSDSTYVEKIASSPFATFRERNSQIKYQFSNDKKQMLIKWYNEILRQWTNELWVKMEDSLGNSLTPNKKK